MKSFFVRFRGTVDLSQFFHTNQPRFKCFQARGHAIWARLCTARGCLENILKGKKGYLSFLIGHHKNSNNDCSDTNDIHSLKIANRRETQISNSWSLPCKSNGIYIYIYIYIYIHPFTKTLLFLKTYVIYIIMSFLHLYFFCQHQKRHRCKKLMVMATMV